MFAITRIITRIFLATAVLLLCANIVFAQDDITRKVYRLPEQKTCAPTLSPKKIEASASGGAYSFRVNLPRNCESSVTYWTDKFISTPGPQDSRGSVTINFRVSANDTRRKRTGFVKITGHVDGKRKRTARVTVVQAGKT